MKAIVATSAKDEELKSLLKAADVDDLMEERATDVEAANRAGIPAIAFRSGGWGDTDLKGAVEIYDGPADLLAQYDSSFLGRNAP